MASIFSIGLGSKDQAGRALGLLGLGLRVTGCRAEGLQPLGTGCSVVGLEGVVKGWKAKNAIWEFPKIGDPNIVPEIVGSLF